MADMEPEITEKNDRIQRGGMTMPDKYHVWRWVRIEGRHVRLDVHPITQEQAPYELETAAELCAWADVNVGPTLILPWFMSFQPKGG